MKGSSVRNAGGHDQGRGSVMPSVNPVVEPEVLDPVCGMSILPSHAVGHVTHRGQTYYFCSQSCLERFQRRIPRRFLERRRRRPRRTPAGVDTREYTCPMDPEVRQIGPAPARSAAWRSSRCRRRAAHEDRVDLPDAPGDRAGRARVVPDLRHGARAARRHARGAEPRARRHDAAVLVVARAHGADPRVHDVGVPARPAAAACAAAGGVTLDRSSLLATPVVLWGGWPFFVRGWASVVNRHLNMFTLIALGVGAAYGSASSRRWRRASFPTRSACMATGRRLLRAGGGDRRARAARPGAGAARAQPDERGDQEPAGSCAEDGAPHRRGRRRGGRAARARARRRSPARAAWRARAVDGVVLEGRRRSTSRW